MLKSLVKDCDRFGKIVDVVGADWKGPLHQHEGAARYLEGSTIPRKINVAADWLKSRITAGDSILDLGCYGGYLYDWLIAQKADGFIYTGVDFNISEAAKAHWRSSAYFVQRDILDYTEPADYVFCARVLMHQPDPIVAIDHAVSLAKRAAVFVTTVWEERIIRKQVFPTGSTYKTTLTKNELNKRYEIEWIEYKDNPNKYSTFVVSP